jgi:hypothetical protein
MFRPAFPLLILTLAVAASAASQTLPPCGDTLDTQTLLERVTDRAERALADAVSALEKDDVARKAVPNPRAAKATGATSSASSTAPAVDAPGLTQLLALAADQGLIQPGEAHAITLDLNGQTLARLVNPGIADSTEAYRALSPLRRLGGKLTLGGKGESFDRDGDGKADEPLEAKVLDDSVAWELQYRLLGSRDRRDSAAASRMIATFRQAHEAQTTALSDVLKALRQFEEARRPERGAAADSSFCSADFDVAFQGDSAVSGAFSQALMAAGRLRADYDAAVKAEDHAFVLTVYSSGIERNPELGPDKLSFGARAVWGSPRLDHTLNLSWARSDATAGLPRPTTFKAGYQASGLIRQVLGGNQAQASLFASWERIQDVPGAKFKTVVQAGGTLELTLASGVKVPLTLKWVNHRDLLAGADEVVGNVGISIDLSELKQAPAPAP